MSARFEPPFIQDNPTGWGPNTIPAQFKDMVSDMFRDFVVRNLHSVLNNKHLMMIFSALSAVLQV